jgi:pimeloyl-ACP methyl ester carboxylesterase
MPKAHVNDIEIEYDTFGDSSSKPILLIMGLGGQMIAWLEELCNYVANQGFFVIRFDNRDVGLSTKFEEMGISNLTELIAAFTRGEKVDTPYTLEDMADDAIGVLDDLNIDKAHICGASMGGMIAQIVAYRHPTRVLSLASIMSTTGNPDLPQATQELLQELFSPPPTDRDAYIKESVRRGRLTYGTFPYNEEQARILAAAAYDRCFYPQGIMRQLAAITANGNRKPKLASIKVPTLVVHGREDPLVLVEGGKDTAEAIPGAELLIIEGMGHSFPIEVAPQIIEALLANTAKVN